MNPKLLAMKKVLEFQRMTDDSLNNQINIIKEKYGMSDDDLVIINTAISVLTTRRIMTQVR